MNLVLALPARLLCWASAPPSRWICGPQLIPGCSFGISQGFSHRLPSDLPVRGGHGREWPRQSGDLLELVQTEQIPHRPLSLDLAESLSSWRAGECPCPWCLCLCELLFSPLTLLSSSGLLHNCQTSHLSPSMPSCPPQVLTVLPLKLPS